MPNNLNNLLAAAATGVPFGFAMEKAKITAAMTLTSQMAFSNFTMMRMFLGACGTSVLSTLFLEKAGLAQRKVNEPLSLGLGLMHGYGSNVVGGMLLGAGIEMSGSCPGSVYVQLGGLLPKAGLVYLGGVAGAFAYGYFDGMIKRRTTKYHKAGSSEPLEKQLGVPYEVLAGGFAAAMAGCIALIDAVKPWRKDLAALIAPGATVSVAPSLTAAAWDPLTAGILVGLMQVPSFLAQGQGLGTSSGYVAVAGEVAAVDKKRDQRAPYFKKFRSKWWQVAQGVGMAAGAALSIKLGGGSSLSAAASTGSKSPLHALGGGFLMLFGARVAGGCTSGHGLTGMAAMSASSLVTVAGMFAGGGLASKGGL